MGSNPIQHTNYYDLELRQIALTPLFFLRIRENSQNSQEFRIFGQTNVIFIPINEKKRCYNGIVEEM